MDNLPNELFYHLFEFLSSTQDFISFFKTSSLIRMLGSKFWSQRRDEYRKYIKDSPLSSPIQGITGVESFYVTYDGKRDGLCITTYDPSHLTQHYHILNHYVNNEKHGVEEIYVNGKIHYSHWWIHDKKIKFTRKKIND